MIINCQLSIINYQFKFSTMMNNRNNNKDKNQVVRFNKITIGLASPESILAESRGEVLKPETINRQPSTILFF